MYLVSDKHKGNELRKALSVMTAEELRDIGGQFTRAYWELETLEQQLRQVVAAAAAENIRQMMGELRKQAEIVQEEVLRRS